MDLQAVILTPADLFYVVLTIFTSIIWTLLIIVLLRVLRILSVTNEIADYYFKLKWLFSNYEKMAELYVDKIKNIIK